MYNYKIIRIVEEHLFLYLWIDKRMEQIKEKYSKKEIDINSWIRSKGRVSKGVEITAINNIQMEEELNNLIKWHNIIKNAICVYTKNDEQEKLNYIQHKYFEKCSTARIEIEMAISRPTQSRIRTDIVYYIAILAIKEKLLELEDFE